MNRILQADFYRYFGTPLSWTSFWKGLKVEGFRFCLAYRMAQSAARFSPRGIFFRWLLARYHWKFGFQIPLRAQIGEGLYLAHLGFIVINNDVRIGRYCNLAPGVTLGQTNRGPRKGSPQLGDCVWVGTNAVVVGKVRIGNNVLIAPGAYVNFDVPDDSIVLGNPARVIPNREATVGYVEHILDPELRGVPFGRRVDAPPASGVKEKNPVPES